MFCFFLCCRIKYSNVIRGKKVYDVLSLQNGKSFFFLAIVHFALRLSRFSLAKIKVKLPTLIGTWEMAQIDSDVDSFWG